MISQVDYWYNEYNIENILSKALEKLLSKISNNYYNRSIDIGCGNGRNLPLLLAISKKVTAIGNSPKVVEQVKKAFGQVDAYTIDIQELNKFYRNEFDIGIAWRILHLGDDEQRDKVINNVVDIMKNNAYLAIAVSSIKCSSYKRKIEKDATIISPGTITRVNERGINDIRHYFTEEEIKRLNPQLQLEEILLFEEMSGGKSEMKKYIAALYKVDKLSFQYK